MKFNSVCVCACVLFVYLPSVNFSSVFVCARVLFMSLYINRLRDLECDRMSPMSVAAGGKRRRGTRQGGAGRGGLLLGS